MIAMAGAPRRLRPGELDGLVLAYLRQHREEGALGARAVARGLERLPGAVANCLARLAKRRAVRQVRRRPRRYMAKEGL